MPTEVKTGVGRIVWGNPLKPQQKKDPVTKQLILKDGQPIIQHVFGLAIPKNDFANTVWPAMNTELRTGYPSGQAPSKFSWKYLDGDSVDSAGKPYAEREGYAGCYILTVSSQTGFAPNVYKWNAAANKYDQVGPDGLKTGDYIVAALSLKVNIPAERTMTPGFYVNPQAIELVGYGTEIVSSGVDPMAVFGGQQYQLPPGASVAPISSAPASVGMPGQMPMQPAPQMQQYQPQQPPMQPQMPAPAHDFVQNAGMQPQQPGMMPAPAMQPQPQYQSQQPMQPQPMQPAAAPGGVPQMPGQMPPR